MLNATMKEFIKELARISNAHHQTQVFADVVRAFRISLQKPLLLDKEYANQLESEYMGFVDKYGAANWGHAAQCLAHVIDYLTESREDFLGHILEEIGASNQRNGQFFTPTSVSRLMASINCDKWTKDYTIGKPITICDPACGAGVLLIEAAEYLIKNGVRQGDIFIIAGDIDGRACDIAYTQFSLLGYPAVVCHQDGLSLKEYERPAYTAGYYVHGLPMRGFNGKRFISREIPHDKANQQTNTPPQPTATKPTQTPPMAEENIADKCQAVINVNPKAMQQMEFIL